MCVFLCVALPFSSYCSGSASGLFPVSPHLHRLAQFIHKNDDKIRDGIEWRLSIVKFRLLEVYTFHWTIECVTHKLCESFALCRFLILFPVFNIEAVSAINWSKGQPIFPTIHQFIWHKEKWNGNILYVISESMELKLWPRILAVSKCWVCSVRENERNIEKIRHITKYMH